MDNIEAKAREAAEALLYARWLSRDPANIMEEDLNRVVAVIFSVFKEAEETKDSGEMQTTDPSLSTVVISQDSSESAHDSKSYFDLNEIAGRRGYSLAHLPYIETPEARRELIDWIVAYDKRLLVPTPTTQFAVSPSNLLPCPFCGGVPELPYTNNVQEPSAAFLAWKTTTGENLGPASLPSSKSVSAAFTAMREAVTPTRYMELRDGTSCWCRDGMADRCSTEFTYHFAPNGKMIHCKSCTALRAAIALADAVENQEQGK